MTVAEEGLDRHCTMGAGKREEDGQRLSKQCEERFLYLNVTV